MGIVVNPISDDADMKLNKIILAAMKQDHTVHMLIKIISESEEILSGEKDHTSYLIEVSVSA